MHTVRLSNLKPQDVRHSQILVVVEVLVAHGLAECDPQHGVVLGHAQQQVIHLGLGAPLASANDSRVLVQRPAVLIGVLGLRGRRVPTELVPTGRSRSEELGRRVGPARHVLRNWAAEDLLHHGQVLQVVMRLEQSMALEGRREGKNEE